MNWAFNKFPTTDHLLVIGSIGLSSISHLCIAFYVSFDLKFDT